MKMGTGNFLVAISFLGWSMDGSELLNQWLDPSSKQTHLAGRCLQKGYTLTLYHLTHEHTETSSRRKRAVTLNTREEGLKPRKNPFPKLTRYLFLLWRLAY